MADDRDRYEATVSSSKEESIQKAADILRKDNGVSDDVHLVRPGPKEMMRCCIHIVFFSASIVCSLAVSHYLGIICGIAMMACLLIADAKNMLVSIILIYQRFAPLRIRSSCVFEPTCSNYMLLAIEKYGVVAGVIKGLKRLGRCHYPNSGEDLP